MENKLPLDILAIDFADSVILSYTVKFGCLILFVKRWNAQILEIKFLEYASSVDVDYVEIAYVQQVFESPLLERILDEFYEKKPNSHNFKIFKFFNSDDLTALEVICENVNVRIIRK